MLDVNVWTNHLIGRDRELAVLGSLLDEAVVDGATLLLSGEPGVGKTALLAAAAEIAATAGLEVIRAGGVEYETRRQLRWPAPARRTVVRRAALSPAVQSCGDGGCARPWLRPCTGAPGGAERVAGALPPGGIAGPAAHRHRRLALAGPRQRRRRRVRRPSAAGQPDRAARCHPARRRRVLRTRRVAGVPGRPALGGRCDGPAGPPVRPSADPCPAGASPTRRKAIPWRCSSSPRRLAAPATAVDGAATVTSGTSREVRTLYDARIERLPEPTRHLLLLAVLDGSGRPGCPGGGERAGRTR